jgi:hypothetical protein
MSNKNFGKELSYAIEEVLSEHGVFESYNDVHFNIISHVNDKKEITKIEITIEPKNTQ